MSLLYFHSPLPPAQTGIADYAFETLTGLKDHFDVVIVDDGNCRASADGLLLPTMPIEVWRDRSGRAVGHRVSPMASPRPSLLTTARRQAVRLP